MGEKPEIEDAVRQVGVTPVTPFTADLRDVDTAAFESNLRFLVESGVELLYPAGNTGEAMSLSPDEWTRVVETCVEASDGRAAVLPGIGQEYPVALELARRARELGADGLLLMPRPQPHIASRGLTAYWSDIAQMAELPVVIYKKSLPEMSDLLDMVSDDAVIACKYAGKDVSAFAQTVSANTADVTWTCGLAERYAPFFHQAGARGFTSGLANFAPQAALDMRAALEAGDDRRALEVRESCLPFEEIRARHADSFNVAAVKTAMDLVGLAGGKVRPPLVDLDDQAVIDVKGAMANLMERGD